jgi:hypothetical protein
MGWKHCEIDIGDNCECILDALALLALSAGDPPEIALLTRTTDDRRRRILALSPLAVELAGDMLPPRWTDCDPPTCEYALMYGQARSWDCLGVPRPSFKPQPQPAH